MSTEVQKWQARYQGALTVISAYRSTTSHRNDGTCQCLGCQAFYDMLEAEAAEDEDGPGGHAEHLMEAQAVEDHQTAKWERRERYEE